MGTCSFTLSTSVADIWEGSNAIYAGGLSLSGAPAPVWPTPIHYICHHCGREYESKPWHPCESCGGLWYEEC